jgi:predicted RNA binding protein YcfA (HicA-like mRNA interferase family)
VTKLPVLSGQDCVLALERAGFRKRRHRGSHVILARDDPAATVTVPMHRELRPGTLRSIIRDADLTVEEFTQFLIR